MSTGTVRGRRIPPGPPPMAAFRMLKLMTRDRLTMMTTAAAYGDAARLPVGHKRLYFFNHPDHAKHVLADNAANYGKGIGLIHARRALGDGLLTSDGELWREQRRVIQPAFQNRRLTQYAGAVGQEAVRLAERLRTHAGGPPVEVLEEMTRLTLGVLGRTLLDADDLSGFHGLGESFGAVQDQAMFEVETLSAVPTWVPLARQRRFRRARRHLQQVVDRLAADRGDDVEGRDDVLSRLLASTRAERDPRVARQRLRDELVTLLLAGHETTASTLGWSLHLLDRHPEWRERLHTEACEVLGDRVPEHNDLLRLRHTTMVVQEAIRLYPPVWLLPRRAKAADEIGGYRVPAGADVLISPYTLHRHERFWDDPERFDPGRFDAGTDRSRYAYIPFGAGPRFCVGSSLGMMEATMVLAVLLRDLRLAGDPDRVVRPQPMLSLRVQGGLPMTVHLARR
jgi:cytochrome P450